MVVVVMVLVVVVVMAESSTNMVVVVMVLVVVVVMVMLRWCRKKTRTTSILELLPNCRTSMCTCLHIHIQPSKYRYPLQ